MSYTLTLSDPLYTKLEKVARQCGFSIEQLLETWQPPTITSSLHQRRETVKRIIALRDRIAATYGTLPDSTDLIREDRMR
jgi:hypothetical protein